MNAYDVLKKDHREVEKLFEQLKSTTHRAEKKRNELFEKLKSELIAHSKAEDRTLYQRLRDHRKTHGEALEAHEEHHVVELLLKELSQMPKNTDEWMAKLTVLCENVKHHVEEEESELFDDAQDIFDEDEAEEIGELIQKEKQKIRS